MIASLDKEHHRDSVKKNDKFQRNVMSSQFFTTKLNNVQLWLKAIFWRMVSKIIIEL